MRAARLVECVRLPLRDAMRGLEAAVQPMGPAGLAWIAVGFVASWWIYVPIHELLHAFGCWATGGQVTRLEIDAAYGAAFLQRLFPFVAVGSAYAGQLTGFDTHESDAVYLATDLAPFALTVVVGVPLLQAVARSPWRPVWRAIGMGAAAPLAFAPFLSLSGDYYEMGSILVTHSIHLLNPAFDKTRWRSDDLLKLATQDLPSRGSLGAADVAGLLAGCLVGVTLSFVTYGLGHLCARWLRRAAAAASGHRRTDAGS